jgi:SAC3 family protein LENG8/THP3
VLILNSYTPHVPIRFITEELGFESDQEALEFLLQYVDESALEQTPEGEVRVMVKKCAGPFEQAKSEAFRVVDIKGQL